MRIAVASTMGPPQAICNTAREFGRHLSRASKYCHQKFEKDGASGGPRWRSKMNDVRNPARDGASEWAIAWGQVITPDAAVQVGTARLQAPGDAVLSERR
jgi:hypothetical protein